MKKLLLALPLLLFVAGSAYAYTPPSDLVGTALQASAVAITNNLYSIAIRLLFAFLLLQWVIDGYAMLAAEGFTTEKVIGKLAFTILWASFCLWLLDDHGSGSGLTNIGHFMQSTVDFFLAKASEWVGLNGGSFDTADIFQIGLVAYGKITIAVVKATATNAVNAVAAVVLPQTTFLMALMVFCTSVCIIACCAYIALKVFLLKIQVALFIALSPLAIAMLGLKGLREQGIAPFKMLLGLVYRIVILAAVISTLQIVAENFVNVIDGLAWGVAADIWTPILGALFGFVLLVFVTHHADNIATSLASGNVALNTGDLAGTVAAGVAAGMTAAAGMAAVQSATGGRSMLDLARGALSGGGEMRNASMPPLSGSGDQSRNLAPTLQKPPEANYSMAESGSGSGGKDQAATEKSASGPTASAPAKSQASAAPSTPPSTPPSTAPSTAPSREDRAAASQARREAREAEKFIESARASGKTDEQIAGIMPPQHSHLLGGLARAAGSLNKELQNDRTHDTGIRIDAHHRD